MRRSFRSLNLNKDKFDLDKAGFSNGVLEVRVSPQFTLVFSVEGEEITAKAIDNDFGDEYIPFNIENSYGETTLMLKEEAEKVFESIKEKVGSKSLDKETLFNHISSTFFVDPVHPFKDPGEAVVFKNEFGKWFVLYMEVSAKHFYPGRDDKVEIINIKLPPKMVQETIKQGLAHKCYHMNKKYWVSIILSEVTLDEVKPLILQSYIESGAKGY